MTQIEPHYVNFEHAKLLKEKEFDNIPCRSLYFSDGEFVECEVKKAHDNYLRPEQWQVVEWLRVNHGIWIYTYPVAPFVTDGEDYPKIVWVSKICSLNQVNFEKFIDADNGLAVNHHRSPQEAYSAAFDYILKELI